MPKTSLKDKISVLFIILMLCILGGVCFLYQFYYKELLKKMEDSLEASISLNVSEVEQIITSLGDCIELIHNNEEAYISPKGNNLSDMADLIVEFNVSEDNSNLLDSMNALRRERDNVEKKFNIAVGNKTDKAAFQLIIDSSYSISQYLYNWTDFSGSGFYSIRNLENIEIWEAVEQQAGEEYWFSHEKYPGRVFLAKQLKYQSLDAFGVYETHNLGIMVVSLDFSRIEERFREKNISEKTQIYLLNQDGSVLYAPNGENDNSDAKEQQQGEYIVYEDELPYGLTLITEIPFDEFQGQTGNIIMVVLLTILIILFSGICFSKYLGSYILKPVLYLAEVMKKGEKTEQRKLLMRNDEIGILYRVFNEMWDKNQELMNEIYQFAEKQKETELRTYQVQMNPHFLYNVLGSVSSYALIQGQDKIAEQLVFLSSILKYNIKNPNKLVTLKEEINIIRQYEEIMVMNYNHKFRFEYDIQKECEGVLVPKLIIQPLVENSIVHGIDTEQGGGYVKICAEILNKDVMVMKVIDSGKSADIDSLNRYIAGACDLGTKEKSIGVKNVSERLRLLFGDSAALGYQRNTLGDTEAVITIHLLGMDKIL